jgi:hypothetical protein
MARRLRVAKLRLQLAEGEEITNVDLGQRLAKRLGLATL